MIQFPILCHLIRLCLEGLIPQICNKLNGISVGILSPKERKFPGNFQDKMSENLGIPREVVLVFGNNVNLQFPIQRMLFWGTVRSIPAFVDSLYDR